MPEPRSTALENSIKAYLMGFQGEYNSFKNKVEGEERRRRMKEELREYTNDQRTEEIKKLAILKWNEMVDVEMGFGSKKTYVPIAKTEELVKVVEKSIDPVMGKIAPVKSKKFRSQIREAIADFGSGIKDVIGSPIKGLTLPAQDPRYKAKVFDPNDNAQLIERLGARYTKITDVKTKQSELSTFQIDFSDPTTLPKDKKYIIHFNGNGTFANQTIPTLAVEGNNHECVVINFDYPGVGESTGKSYRSKQMVDAGLAQVQRLLDMGVPAQNIMLKGQSIGGGVATLTAAKMHEKGQRVNLYNERSFSKLSDVPAKAIGGPIGKLIGFVLKKTGWEMNAIKAWNKIPEQYKEYCYAKYDEVIPPKISGLAGALAKQRAKENNPTELKLEKEKNKERKLLVGHNDRIYDFDHGGDLITHGTANANGKRANIHFDNFARKRFADLEITLDKNLKEQFSKIEEGILKKPSTAAKPGHKVLFGFKKGDSKELAKIKSILKEINAKGKISNHQLDTLQNLCHDGQKKAKSNATVNVPELAKMLKEMKKSLNNQHQDQIENKEKARKGM